MLNRTAQPAFQKSSAFNLIHPETTVLRNGIPVTIVRGGEQAVAKIEFVFEAGKWHETQAGVSYFTTHQLQKGTPSKTSYQISSENEQLGIHLEVSPGYDFSGLSLYGLTKNIGQVLELTRELITTPVFPQHELDQMKNIYLQTLKINLQKTSHIASVELRKKLFGTDHPYGRDAGVAEVENISRNELVGFHTNHFGNLRIICSGYIPESLLQGLMACFETLSLRAKPETKHEAIRPEAREEFIGKAESVQSSLRVGCRTIGRTDTDYPALLLLNHILGGYFGSRLMKNIREEKGLTYGIHSSVNALKHGSFIAIGTDVNKENRELALQEIKNEMLRLCNELISSNELETARNHFIGSLQSEITTPFAHADKIKNLLLFDLPADYYQQLINKIDSVSAQHLQKVAMACLDPKKFTSITVG